MQDFPHDGDDDYPPPPPQEEWPAEAVTLRSRPPRRTLVVVGGLLAAVVAVAAVAAVGGGRSPSPAPRQGMPTVRAVVAGPDEAALGKLAGAMKGGAATEEPPSPTPPAEVGVPPRDSAAGPGAARAAPPHDASPYDAAPAPLPVEQSLLSPVPIERALVVDGARRAHPRAAWDGLAKGDATRLSAIDRAGTLVEQGDLKAARDALSPLVDAGDALAAFAMAETYDPARLKAWGDATDAPDVARAREFYGKALAGGVAQARVRIETLP